MKLVQSILTKNPCYTAGRKITVKGLMLHSVGCSQPKASVFINNWNSPNYTSACVHGFIDGNDGTVYQTLPWDHRGWHAASGKNGSANNTHIGVEMCEPSCIKYTTGANFTCSDLPAARASVEKTYRSAVELYAMLCKQYHLDPLADGVVISHKEGCARGIASNHGDPEHLWKGLGMGYTMDTFRRDVKAAMGGTTGSTTAQATASSSGDMTDAEMFAFFKAQGLTDAGSAGLMGNLYKESALAANNLQNNGNTKLGMTDAQYTAAVDSGAYTNFVRDGYGYGLAQWTYYTRKQALLDFMKAAGVSVGHKRKQCEFILKELAGYPAVLQTLKTAKTVKEASNAVLLQYERPADQSQAVQDARAAAGQVYFDKYASGKTEAAPAAALPYMVRVKIADLNIRTGPGTNYPSKGYIAPGAYTIVQESTGQGASKWGKLKSGAGWIALGYTEKI